MRSLFLKFEIVCGKCGESLAVNSAAESILCVRCFSHTNIPVEFWQSLVTPQLVQASKMDTETDTWANGITAGIGSYKMEFGRQTPRCQNCETKWNLEELIEKYKNNSISMNEPGKIACLECKKIWSFRRPPDWFDRVMPFTRFLVGETSEDAQKVSFKGESSVSIFCYNCGGPLFLNGSERTVRCEHCGNDCLVPDDIWLRLHPVLVSHPWYIIIDIAEGTDILPEDIHECIDLAALPDDDTALLWEESGEYRIGRYHKSGVLLWSMRDFFSSDYARLFYVESSNTLWVLDHDEEVVHAFAADSGKRLLTIENEEGEPEIIAVKDNYNVTVCSDDTILVYRRWEKDNSPNNISEQIRRAGPHILTASEIEKLNQRTGLWGMRRFDENGRRIPLWPGHQDSELDQAVPEWSALRDHPVHPPNNAMLESGPDGTLYVIDPISIFFARYDRSGKYLGIVAPDQKIVESAEDCAVSRDGTLYIIFNHRKKIGRESWSHIARIGLDGKFELLVGPHAKKYNYSIGNWSRRLSVTPNGSIHTCAWQFKDLRALNPDGSTLWLGLWTSGYDRTQAEELDAARKKKS